MTRRPDGSLVVSLVVHLVLGAVLYYLLTIPLPNLAFWETPAPKQHQPPTERVQYVQMQPARAAAGPTREPATRTNVAKPVVVPLVAPEQVPTGIPAPASSDTSGAGGNGGLGSTGGAAKGLVPSYGDRRLWANPGPYVGAPKTATEKLDSVIVTSIREHLDSLAAATPSRRPGDWTFSRGGKKYGMDSRNIYIGDIKIPTPLLALLPLNSKHLQGNPVAIQNARRIQAMHDEIMEQAQRGMTEAEFRAAVKRIAERKAWERQQEEQKKKDRQKDPPASGPDQLTTP